MTNSCCLCWSCRNPHFASAVSFHSCRFTIIPTVDVIVQVNMHSFLPCFTNMHSALIQESDTFHNSHWLFLVWGEKHTHCGDSVALLGCWDSLCGAHGKTSFCIFILSARKNCNPIVWVCSAHHCSQVQWAYVFCHCSFVCYAISCLCFLYKHKRKFSKMTSNNPTATWLLLTIWC